MRETIPAPLAKALADKGYDTLTAVQETAVSDEVAGRDLLVSAQTGSGKTVAFGLAMAPDLLRGEDRLPDGLPPLALAIAPTRELALQVARELEWLYAAAGARIATCVGGMDARTERRALERAPQIVVGTPGRLRDHIERGALDLSALRVAVLDEADEMLDLGFREDLEFILGAASPERRTLLFSATVPPGIEALARDFQKDALRLAAGGEARQHGDISYRAYSVATRDRDNAIFNILRYHDAEKAIVFCKTRANVNHLLARMGNRGFKVVALSGELSQAERSHALQALRDGRAQVCIATDVAARGIDLPGLNLVIHADLPTNAETLLHRSGRTGRAGAKGISALVVPGPEFKKAQRLLKFAKVEAEWAKAPDAEEVMARDEERLFADPILTAALDDGDDLPARLLAAFTPEALAAAFVRQWRAGRPTPEEMTSSAPVPGAEAGPRRERAPFGPSVWYQIPVGRKDRAEPRWLLPRICNSGGVEKTAIGAINLRYDESFVQVAAGADFGPELDLGQGLVMRRIEGEPPAPAPWQPREEREERPARAPAPRRERPAEAPAPAAETAPAPEAPKVTKPLKARWTEGEKKARKREKEAFDPTRGGAVKPEGKPAANSFARPSGKPGGKPGPKPGGKPAPRAKPRAR